MKKKFRVSTSGFLVIGFATIILVGALLLLLPVSIKDGVSVNFYDTLFTATSATCVTGLVVKDTFDTFTFFGRTIIAILIQIGGLGFSTVAVLLLLALGRKVDMNAKFYAKEGLNINSMANINVILRNIIRYTFAVEGVGAILSAIAFSKYFEWPRAITLGIFHSVSSFNNAGFDSIGNYVSLMNYSTDIFLNTVTMLLIVIGGLGYYVLSDVFKKKKFEKLSFHSKISITMAGCLIVFGTIFLFWSQDLTFLQSLFQSITTRTAGFSTTDIGQITHGGLLLMIVLMFIGASPSSTGGGVKTTTIFVVFSAIYCSFRNKQVTAFNRGISNNIILRAFILIVTSITLVIIASAVLMSADDLKFLPALFETVSAFATVGLTTGITPSLSYISRAALMLLMFFGRLGPITMGYLMARKIPTSVKLVDEDVLIG